MMNRNAKIRIMLQGTLAVILLGGCQPGAVTVGPAPLPGSSAAALGAYKGVNRAKVEGDLLAQLRQYGRNTDKLQLHAEYAAATEVAATTLADWARRLDPAVQAREDVSGYSRTRVTIIPPAQFNVSADVSWGPVWGISMTSPARPITETDVKQWAAMLAQLSLDERWRLATYYLGRPVAPRREP
jgi:hypothetical protein